MNAVLLQKKRLNQLSNGLSSWLRFQNGCSLNSLKKVLKPFYSISLAILLILISLSPNSRITAQSIGVGVSTSQEEVLNNITESGHSRDGYKKSIMNQEKILESELWQPTDYVYNDIANGSYIVQLGDTLWEIAEAYYGSSNEWTKILNLNTQTIGFLEDGSQALIFPQQVLKM